MNDPSDLMLGIIVMPFSLSQEVVGYWLFGAFWCQVHSMENIVAEITFQFWAILGNFWQFLAIFGNFWTFLEGYLSNLFFHSVL